MKIAKISSEFKTFFNRFRDIFTRNQFSYFSIYVYGLIVMFKENKNVTQISKAWIQEVSRPNLEKFLCEIRWDFEKLM